MSTDKIHEIAEKFITLASTRPWHEIRDRKFPDEEIQILFDLVSAAGFSPLKVVPGVLYAYNRDQDGSALNQYQFNGFPYATIGQDGEADYFATGWLDNIFSLVRSGGPRWEKRTLVEQLTSEIERSVPLEPIEITPQGDLLTEYPRQPLFTAYPYFVDHVRDGHEMSSCVGIHAYCGGWVDRYGATAIQHALVCRRCGLRVLFPKDVKTYGDLRQVLTHRFLIPT